MTPNLKVLCGQVVMESSLTKPSKLQLLRYIREANEPQLKAFLLDGEIVKIDEQSKEIINERFETSKFPDILNEFVATAVLGLAILGAKGWVAWRAIKGATSEASRRCGVLRISSDRSSCLAKVKIEEAGKKIRLLQKARSACSNHKDPRGCTENLDSKIKSEQEKLQTNKEKLRRLTMKGRGGGKPSKGTEVF
jgi:hypothetical protein